MKKQLFLIGLFCGIVVVSCTDSGIDPDNKLDKGYLIFGSFFGECFGEECVEIFKIENGKVYEDINDNYPRYNMRYEGSYVELTAEKHNVVDDLIDYFPSRLLEETETVLGEPDAGDWGGWYVEVRYDGEHRFWLIDNHTGNLPEYLESFVDTMRARRNILQE